MARQATQSDEDATSGLRHRTARVRKRMHNESDRQAVTVRKRTAQPRSKPAEPAVPSGEAHSKAGSGLL